jgi:molybdopterin-biosynthesis enzyme MoeA-like protein
MTLQLLRVMSEKMTDTKDEVNTIKTQMEQLRAEGAAVSCTGGLGGRHCKV